MSLETGIYAVLTCNVAVAKRVQTRVYPSEFPEGCHWPAILYHIPDEKREPTMRTSGIPIARLTVTAFCENAIDSTALADDIAKAMDGYGGTIDGTKILIINFTGRTEGWDYELSTMGLYFCELTFEVFYRD